MINTRGKHKEKTGVVVSDKMQKTIIVNIERLAHHPVYKRTIRKSVKVKVHDEKNQAKTGDTVKIRDSRPLSKDKRWILVEVVKK